MPGPSSLGPLDDALQRVGDRWRLLIVDALLGGPMRFNEFGNVLTGLAPNILTSRLRQLLADGVVVAAPYSYRPLRLRYELTEKGHDLANALRLLAAWGVADSGADRGGGRTDGRAGGRAMSPAEHPVCGTPVELRLWCPTCGRLADECDAAALDTEPGDGLEWL